jgi:hypothetical protein
VYKIPPITDIEITGSYFIKTDNIDHREDMQISPSPGFLERIKTTFIFIVTAQQNLFPQVATLE